MSSTYSSRPASPALRTAKGRLLFLAVLLVLFVAFLTGGAPPAQAISSTIVISQVYGGGGNSGATFTHDFIELFNRGTTTVSLNGWSVQYASATGTSWQKTDLSGSLQPGQYYLIQQAQGSGGTTPLPTPDASGAIPMSATAGKVALLNVNTLITSGTSCPSGATVVDFVGFGSTANCFEGSGPTPAPSNTTSVSRLTNGCVDTDNNAADFTAGAPNPRNTASAFNTCSLSGIGLATPNVVAQGGSTLLTVEVVPGPPPSSGFAVTADLSAIGGSAAQPFFDDGSNGDVTPGDNVFSYLTTVNVTSAGAKNLPAALSDAQGRTGNASIALSVRGDLVISQVYGGGGNTGAPYTHDFVELYNRDTLPIDVTGWSVQYASAAGSSWGVTVLSGAILPGKYYLIQLSGGSNGVPLPTPDATGATNMSATNGKVALVAGSTAFSGTCPTGGAILDFVGYGSTANCFEGSGPTGTLSNTTAAIRNGAGMVDTDDNAADFTVAAPTPRNSSNEDQAPAVASTSPFDGAIGVAADTDIIVTFSEPVNVAGAWFTIVCTSSGSHTAAVSGGPTTFTLNPDSDFDEGESCTVTIVASQVTDVDTDDPPDTMEADYVWSFTILEGDVCELPFLPIYDIQGDGATTPYAGQTVTTQGVVVGDFQGPSFQNGFYLQDPVGDGNPLTSDGIFVFVPVANPLSSVDVSVGDVVRLTGRAIEFNTLTEIDFVESITICGAVEPLAPTVVTLPELVNNDLERYEGMLITIPQTLTVSQNFFQGRYGQVTLSADGRLYNPTNLFLPGSSEAIAQADENARRLLVLDDGRTSQNPNPIPYIGADNTLRAGDVVTGVTGVLDYGLISSDNVTRDYRLQPTIEPVFTRVNHRTAAPDPVDGNVKVAAFNVLNYFNGNGSGLDGAAGGFPTARGANNLNEFNRQRAKIIAALAAIDADVVGLMELENDAPPNSAIEDLVAGLNAATAAGTYSFIDTGIVGSDEIRVGILYKPGTVTPAGSHAVLTSAVDPLFNDSRNRPAIAQTFDLNSTGARFTVVVNHLKSKGSSCADIGDPDLGDGQGNCNVTRTNAAIAIANWLATDPTGSGDPDFMITGDLNAYAKEDPITALIGAGYVNLIEDFVGDIAYSYIFDGQSGYLDHALATATLASQVTGVTEWHINTDEPSVIDYNTEFKPQDLYEPTPYRSSDHDPVIVGLNLNAPPTVSAGGPYSVGEGGSVIVTASGSDPDGGLLTYEWDLDNNGSFETPGQSATFSAAALTAPSAYTIAVRVTDEGGLTAVDTTTVSVIYNFNGFFTPVANPPTLNSVKAGQAIPVKFSLGGDKGLDIFATGYPASQTIACDTNAPVVGLEGTDTAGGSSLTYNASADQYHYVWKTEKAWANTCRQLVLRFDDGAEYFAYFQFK